MHHVKTSVGPIEVTIYTRPDDDDVWVVEVDTSQDHEPNHMLSVWINDDHVHMTEEER